MHIYMFECCVCVCMGGGGGGGGGIRGIYRPKPKNCLTEGKLTFKKLITWRLTSSPSQNKINF